MKPEDNNKECKKVKGCKKHKSTPNENFDAILIGLKVQGLLISI
tara:strand:- start:56 stop:187 length:132 start_codon:yes stop_codon:yes gene_type:complete